MGVQRAKRDMILAGNKCWHSLVTGMMLCSAAGAKTNITRKIFSIWKKRWIWVRRSHLTNLKRQTVWSKPGGTEVVPSVASWCSPFDWHSGSFPHVQAEEGEKKQTNISIMLHVMRTQTRASLSGDNNPTSEESLGKWSPPRVWTHM